MPLEAVLESEQAKEKLPLTEFKLEQEGLLPIECFAYGDMAKAKVLLNAGIHGDEAEPIGPFVNAFLEARSRKPDEIGDHVAIPWGFAKKHCNAIPATCNCLARKQSISTGSLWPRDQPIAKPSSCWKSWTKCPS